MKRESRETRTEAKRPRVCVVDSWPGESAYGRLDECDVEVMAVLPRISEVTFPVPQSFDLMIIGCDATLLVTSSFERRVAQIAQYTRILGVASQPTPEIAARAARIGFHGFIAREVEPEAFQRAVRAVLNGELAFPRTAMSAVILLIRRAYGRGSRPASEVELTPRQRQIVNLIAQGANDREIADVLRIRPSTVHKHVQNALRRTNTKTRSHLAAALGHSAS